MKKRFIDYQGAYETHVIDEDVCQGVPGDPWECAYIKAIKREHPELTYARAGHGTISFTDRESRKRVTVRTSLAAMAAQERYDAGESMTAADFPPLRINMDETKIEDIEFNEHKRVSQNKRRLEIRQGKRKVNPMSEAEKNKRRRGRRAA